MLARFSPGATTLRPFLHRLRGVKVGKSVWIGEDVFLENEYPEAVELQDHCAVSMRAMIVTHTRGIGKVVVEPYAAIGPGAIVCASGRTIRISRGAVIAAGAVITASVGPGLIVTPPRSVAVGTASIPLPMARSKDDFVSGIRPLARPKSERPPSEQPPIG